MIHNGRVYLGQHSASTECVAMLGALGVKLTPSVLQKLVPYVGSTGKVLYNSAVKELSAAQAVAFKAQALCVKVLGKFNASPATLEAFSAWQALENGASAEERASMKAAAAAATALEVEHGLPAGSIKLPSAAKAGKSSIAAAEEARNAYATMVVGQFKAALKLGIKTVAVQDYATSHYSAVASFTEAGIESASIALPSTRTGGNGSGTRRGFLKPSEVAGIAFAGSWKATASQLLAAGVVSEEEHNNFLLRPALGRAARALKDKQFVFASGTFTGEQVLATLDAFRVANTEE